MATLKSYEFLHFNTSQYAVYRCNCQKNVTREVQIAASIHNSGVTEDIEDAISAEIAQWPE